MKFYETTIGLYVIFALLYTLIQLLFGFNVAVICGIVQIIVILIDTQYIKTG